MSEIQRQERGLVWKGADIDDLVDRVYDVAVAPERMEQLVDLWMRRLGDAGAVEDHGMLVESGLIGHVQRAEKVLRELMAFVGEERDSAREWTEAARSAALVVNRSGVVPAANATARRTLWLTPGNALGVLAVVPDDLAVLADLVEHLDTELDTEVRLLRLRKLGESAPILIRVVGNVGGDPDKIGLVTSILSWPEQLSSQLLTTFQLEHFPIGRHRRGIPFRGEQ